MEKKIVTVIFKSGVQAVFECDSIEVNPNAVVEPNGAFMKVEGVPLNKHMGLPAYLSVPSIDAVFIKDPNVVETPVAESQEESTESIDEGAV